MNANITFNDSKVTIVASAQTKLPDLAFALEFAANNFAGRGIYRFSAERQKHGEATVVELNSLLEPTPRPMLLSQVCSLADAIRQKVIPQDILPTDTFLNQLQDQPIKPAADGQNRQRTLFNFSDKGGWVDSVIESVDINPGMPLAVLSYGFADMTTGLFALGVKTIKYQFSRKTSQIYIRHKMPEEKLIAFFRQEGNDYPLDMTVGKLP
jgi:hypothetical protein